MKLRLGVRFTNLPSQCCCPPRQRICQNGVHIFSCNEFKGFQLLRHNAIQNDVKHMAQHGNIKAMDTGLSGLIEVDGRQGDLLLSGCGRHNKDLMLHFFISHPCNNSYILQASSVESYALSLVEDRKITKYAAAYRRVGISY